MKSGLSWHDWSGLDESGVLLPAIGLRESKEIGAGRRGRIVLGPGFFGGFQREPRAADYRFGFIDSLSDVEIELFTCRNADIESVTFNRIEDLLGISV